MLNDERKRKADRAFFLVHRSAFSLDPLLADQFEVAEVLFIKPLWTFRRHDAREEVLGFVFDRFAQLAHVDPGCVEIVFRADNAQRFLSGVLAYEIRQAAIEHPYIVIRQWWRDAVAFERVSKVFEFLFPRQMRIEAKGDVLSDLVGFVCVTVADAISHVDLLRVIRFGMADLRQRRKLTSLSNHNASRKFPLAA